MPANAPTPPIAAYQGAPGAHSHMAAREARPALDTLALPTFDDVFAAVADGRAGLGVIPVDNAIAGRVADVHHLLRNAALHIVGEYFHPVRHHLIGIDGATLDGVETVSSHVHALDQCRDAINALGLQRIVAADTAGAARDLAAAPDLKHAVIASDLAAEIYGLQILRRDIHDIESNRTRFLLMAREPSHPDPNDGPAITTLVFRVRSVPASLYKALGGFATNGVNITKLESYVAPNFDVAQFYADIEGHPEDRLVRLALEELGFFSREVRILGVYPAARERKPA